MNYDKIHEYLQGILEDTQQMNCESLQIRNPRNSLFEAKSIPGTPNSAPLEEDSQFNKFSSLKGRIANRANKLQEDNAQG